MTVRVPDAIGAKWRKSSRSNGAQNCVEVADMTDRTAVRDSKNPTGPKLTLPVTRFRSFLNGLRGASS